MTATTWDAEAYDRQAAPQLAWGQVVLDRLDLEGSETVLDAGCGSGKVTALILDRLGEGRVVGVDASPDMIEKARAAIGDDRRVELRVQNLLDLEVSEPVDAIFSSAVFHWILEHERLFERLHAALRPGGRLEAQCGGTGNIAEIERVIDSLAGDERFAPYLRPEQRAWNYASVGDTELRLQRAGFATKRVWLQPWPVTPRDPRGFLATVILPWHLDRLPSELHGEFLDAVLGGMPGPLVVEYVRLNISARRPPSDG
jgi:trans-aconitate 2-methyltransferase